MKEDENTTTAKDSSQPPHMEGGEVIEQQQVEDRNTYSGDFTPAKFQPRYQRNNKRGGLKNLRCFPLCGSHHKERGFCGRPVVISINHKELESKNGQVDIMCWAQFVPYQDKLKFGVGAAMPLKMIVELERSKELPLQPWMRGKKLRASEAQEYMTDKNASDYSINFGFNMDMKGWHYGWASNKHSCNAEHCLQVYVFELETETSVAHLNMDEVLEMKNELVGISSPFPQTIKELAIVGPNQQQQPIGQRNNEHDELESTELDTIVPTMMMMASTTTTAATSSSSSSSTSSSPPPADLSVKQQQQQREQGGGINKAKGTTTGKQGKSKQNGADMQPKDPVASIMDNFGQKVALDHPENIVLRCKAVLRSPRFQLFCRRRRRFILEPTAPLAVPKADRKLKAEAGLHHDNGMEGTSGKTKVKKKRQSKKKLKVENTQKQEQQQNLVANSVAKIEKQFQKHLESLNEGEEDNDPQNFHVEDTSRKRKSNPRRGKTNNSNNNNKSGGGASSSSGTTNNRQNNGRQRSRSTGQVLKTRRNYGEGYYDDDNADDGDGDTTGEGLLTLAKAAKETNDEKNLYLQIGNRRVTRLSGADPSPPSSGPSSPTMKRQRSISENGVSVANDEENDAIGLLLAFSKKPTS